MWLELIRIVADGLQHATYGVNPKLGIVPLDPGDAAPPPFASGAIQDMTRHPQVALGRVCTILPGLMVGLADEMRFRGYVATTFRDTAPFTDLFIGYAVANDAIEQAVASSSYVIRAVLLSVRELMRNAQQAARTRNQVYLEHIEELIVLPVFAPIADSEATLTAGVLARCKVRDLAP